MILTFQWSLIMVLANTLFSYDNLETIIESEALYFVVVWSTGSPIKVPNRMWNPSKYNLGFCPQELVRLLYPLFFNLFTSFMHFSLEFLNKRNLGFLIFQLFLIIFVHWVFVLRCYKHDSHTLIWLIWWFENNWNWLVKLIN